MPSRRCFICKDQIMGRTLIELDEEALAVAQQVLGTKTKQDTINRALQEVQDRAERHEARLAAERLAAEALDLDALMDKGWSRADISGN